MDNKELELREKICEIGRRIYDRKMVAANDGNISVRLGDNEFLCTPTGVSKGFMTPECICKVDSSGKVIEEGSGFKPSSEMKMHLRVYEKRSDVNAVVHAHPMFATSFAIVGIPLDKPIISEAILTLGKIPIAPYATPSTNEVPDSVEPFLQDNNAVLLANHGALTWASDLLSAYLRMESLEYYAEIMYRTCQLGGAKEISPENVERLYEIRKNMKFVETK